ncbi:MAG: thiamine pyrophosphate-dependent enzyme, partial [Beijerinckiaceae bacterium]
YSGAREALRKMAEAHGIPVAETQAGKSAMGDDQALCLGSIGVTGTSAANAMAEQADVIIAIGTRMQDFTTGSWALFKNPSRRFLHINVAAFDAAKQFAQPLISDARVALEDLHEALAGWRAPEAWTAKAEADKQQWTRAATTVTALANTDLPSDAQVIGAVMRVFGETASVVCAAGGLPGELHKLWNATAPGSYHLEYGYSTMGYEIAGGLGVKMAQPERDVVVMVGDGSYLMMNSEIATAVMMGVKLTIVVLDNRGFGCINRLQQATGSAGFNNLLKDAHHVTMPQVDFSAHAASLGAHAVKVSGLGDLDSALRAAKANPTTAVVVIDTDPLTTTQAGGHWWDVAVPEVSPRQEVNAAREKYEQTLSGKN